MSENQYINILGEQISCIEERLNINKLKFYPKNPRVLSKLSRAGKLNGIDEEKQKVIKKAMQDENSVKKLLKTIKHHGGISQPLIVQNETLEVLEGNSRLAALHILCKRYPDEEAYLTAPCRMVKLNESQIDALLHQQHVDGQTPWETYDKAYSVYQRVKIDGVPVGEYAKNISSTENKIQEQIDIIELMKSEGMEKQKNRFSHYDLIVRSRKLRSALKTEDSLRPYLLEKIKEKEPPFTAAEMRDDIPIIAKKPKVLKRLINGTYDFKLAKDFAEENEPKKYLAKALGLLNQISAKHINQLNQNDRNSLNIEVKRCRKQIDRVKNLLESK